ncbi:MAG TPA: GH25 family lysozyme [Roseiarcus sp.]|nr:GH25 family lysozyme [Roseiarcus sp.]
MMLDAKRLGSGALAGGALMLGALLAGCGGGAGPIDVAGLNYPRPHDYPVHGIDVSKFQGAIDWNRVADSGVKFAWIKATEGGDHADERFQANWEGAKGAGVPHGAYHFVYWCRPPMEEMAFFEQNAPVEPDALPPVLDVEATPTSPTCHRHLTQEGAIRDMQVMLDEMEHHYGKRPVIYTTVDFYQAILADGAFENYPIWVRSTKFHPSVKYGGRVWRFWQYQSDGYVPGIGGKVDKDAFSGTVEQWAAFLREPGAGQAEVRPAAPVRALTEEAAAAAPDETATLQPAVEALAPPERIGATDAARQAAGSSNE